MQALDGRSTGKPGRSARWLTIALFLAPALLLYAVFVLVPIVQAAHFSLYKWNGLGPLEDFIGLKNYQVALASDLFRQAVTNNVLIIVLSLTLQIPFSLALAVMLQRQFRGRPLVPAAVLPAVCPLRGGHRRRLPVPPSARIARRCESQHRRAGAPHPGLAG